MASCGRPKIDIDEVELAHYIEIGFNRQQLAETYHVSLGTIGRVLRETGMQTNDRRTRLSENGIDQEAFDVMDEATLKEILPEKSQTGLRLKFWNKYNTHRAKSSPGVIFDLLDVKSVTNMSLLSEESIPSTASCNASVSSLDLKMLTDDESCISQEEENDLNPSQASQSLDSEEFQDPPFKIEPDSQPSLKRIKTSTKFDVLQILRSTKNGRKAIQDIQTNHAASNKHKQTITNMCANYLRSKYGSKPSADIKEEMASSIVGAFPALKDPEGTGYEHWYAKGCSGRPAKGSLEFRLKYLRRSDDDESPTATMKVKEKIDQKPDIGPNLEEEDESVPEEIATKIEWLKHNDRPEDQVSCYMMDTAKHRWKFSQKHKEGKNLDDILSMFPRLMSAGMIEQDYRVMFPEQYNCMYQKWASLASSILSYTKITVSQKWEDDLGVEANVITDISEEERAALGFFVLPYMFHGKKGKGLGRASVRETGEFFIDFQKEGTGLDHFLNNFKGRKQPVILVLGGTYRKPGQSYVILERKAYPCASLVGAVDLGYKVFQILDLCYPPQASGIWSFFDLIVYGAKTSKEMAANQAIQQFRAFYHFTTGPTSQA